AGLAQVSLRALLTDVLTELSPAQKGDEPRAEEHAQQERRGSGDQYPDRDRARVDHRQRAHKARLSIRDEQTSARPTPREPLTSTTSPGFTSACTSGAASAALATLWSSPEKPSAI